MVWECTFQPFNLLDCTFLTEEQSSGKLGHLASKEHFAKQGRLGICMLSWCLRSFGLTQRQTRNTSSFLGVTSGVSDIGRRGTTGPLESYVGHHSITVSVLEHHRLIGELKELVAA